MGIASKIFKISEEVLKKPRQEALRKVEKFAMLSRNRYANRLANEWPSKPIETGLFKRSIPAEVAATKRVRNAAGESGAKWWRERRSVGALPTAEAGGVRETVTKDKFVSSVMSRNDSPKKQLKISPKQWEMLLDRITTREGKVARVNAQKEGMTNFIMNQEPPQTQVMGRIDNPIMMGGEQIGVKPQDYPYPEAALRYLKGIRAGENIKPGGYVPPVDRLTTEGDNVLYKRQVWRPLTQENPATADIAAGVQQEMPQMFPNMPGREDYVKQAGGLKARGQQVVNEIKKVKTLQMTPTDQMIQMGMVGDRVWKYIGGQRTLTGKFWNALREGSRGRIKVADTKSYFMRCFLKWSLDKEAFAKTSPREAKSLETIWDNFSKEYGDILGGIE